MMTLSLILAATANHKDLEMKGAGSSVRLQAGHGNGNLWKTKPLEMTEVGSSAHSVAGHRNGNLWKKNSLIFPGVNLDLACPNGEAHKCPCCGACIATWQTCNGNQACCPVCNTVDRHRAACYDFLVDPPRALFRYPSLPALVAYFGPHHNHTRTLRGAVPKIHLLEFDYFAPGYQYSRSTVRADVQNIPLQDESLDGIIILHVLEHVPSLERALDELYRVLRPNGFLYHETPCNRWTRIGPPDQVEDCATSRLHGNATWMCRQKDHLNGFGCAFLMSALNSRFKCVPAPSSISLAAAFRFLGPPSTDVATVQYQELPGRVRCTKQPAQSQGAGSKSNGNSPHSELRKG